MFVKNLMKEENISSPHTTLRISRLQTLTDGIFAIAMTILVLAIDIPTISPGMLGSKLHDAILGQMDQLFAYGMSFILLALFWTINHKQSRYIVKTNSTHVWINIFILAFICLVPYTTNLKSEFPTDWMADLYLTLTCRLLHYYIC